MCVHVCLCVYLSLSKNQEIRIRKKKERKNPPVILLFLADLLYHLAFCVLLSITVHVLCVLSQCVWCKLAIPQYTHQSVAETCFTHVVSRHPREVRYCLLSDHAALLSKCSTWVLCLLYSRRMSQKDGVPSSRNVFSPCLTQRIT